MSQTSTQVGAGSGTPQCEKAWAVSTPRQQQHQRAKDEHRAATNTNLTQQTEGTYGSCACNVSPLVKRRPQSISPANGAFHSPESYCLPRWLSVTPARHSVHRSLVLCAADTLCLTRGCITVRPNSTHMQGPTHTPWKHWQTPHNSTLCVHLSPPMVASP